MPSNRPYTERLTGDKAGVKALAVLSALAERQGEFVSRHDLPGLHPTQTVARLRNTYGAGVIESRQGQGYRITSIGLTVLKSIDPAMFAAKPVCEKPAPTFRPASPRPLDRDGKPQLFDHEIEPGRSVRNDWDKALFEPWERRKARLAAERATRRGQAHEGAAHG